MFDPSRLKNFDRDDVLKMIGLQTRRDSTDALLTGIGLFGAGVLVGAGVALLFAPRSGSELRQELKGRLNPEDRGAEAVSELHGIGGTEKARTL